MDSCGVGDKPRLPVFSMALMVTGNLLGAGILALPITLGPAGLLPSVAGIVVVWWIMLQTAYILADQPELVQGEKGGLPTFFGRKMGPSAKWLAVAADLVILYGLLTAYLSGTTSILINQFDVPLNPKLVCLGYFVCVAGLGSFGMVILRKCNAAILISMAVLFLALLALIIPQMSPARAVPMRWGFLPVAMPVVLTAFLFHNLIPTVCRELSCERAAVRRAMLIGSVIGLVMNLSWTVVVFCALPMVGPSSISILGALDSNLPATIPLSHILHSPMFTNVGLAFAVLSMSAAYISNATALKGFLLDLAGEGGHRPVLIWGLTFLPPLLVALFYPDIFLIAMNVVGGFGICVLFGILPSLLLFRSKGGRKAVAVGCLLMALFGGILFFQTGHELGLTDIHPDKEYWVHHDSWQDKAVPGSIVK